MRVRLTPIAELCIFKHITNHNIQKEVPPTFYPTSPHPPKTKPALSNKKESTQLFFCVKSRSLSYFFVSFFYKFEPCIEKYIV